MACLRATGGLVTSLERSANFMSRSVKKRHGGDALAMTILPAKGPSGFGRQRNKFRSFFLSGSCPRAISEQRVERGGIRVAARARNLTYET